MATMKTVSSKKSLFSHVKYEHMVAGISGGVTSTLILHPLDLIKIRFAGKLKIYCICSVNVVRLSFTLLGGLRSKNKTVDYVPV